MAETKHERLTNCSARQKTKTGWAVIHPAHGICLDTIMGTPSAAKKRLTSKWAKLKKMNYKCKRVKITVRVL